MRSVPRTPTPSASREFASAGVGAPTLAAWVLVAGLAGSFLALSGSLHQFAEIPKRMATQAAALLGALAAVVTLARAGQGWQFPRTAWPALAFLGWAAVTAVGALDRYTAFYHLLHGTLCLLAWVVAAQPAVRFSPGLWLRALAASGSVSAAIGLLSVWNGGLSWLREAARPAATFGNVNWAAEAIALAGAAAVASLAASAQSARDAGRPAREPWLWAGGAALCYGYILHSFTAATWLAVGVQGVVGAVWFVARRRTAAEWLRPSLRPLAAAAVAALAIAHWGEDGPRWLADKVWAEIAGKATTAAAAPKVVDAVEAERRAEEAGQSLDRSTLQRLEAYQVGAEMVRQRPLFGWGLGNVSNHWQGVLLPDGTHPPANLQARWELIHSDPLQIAVETGLPGLLLVLAGLAWAGWQVARRALPPSPPWAVAAALAWGVGTAGVVVNSLFAFPLYLPTVPFVLALGLGAILAPAEAPRAGRGRWAFAAGTLLGAALALWTWAAVRAARVDYTMGLFQGSIEMGRWDIVRRAGAAVQGQDLGRRDYLLYWGQSHLLARDFAAARAALERYAEANPFEMNGILLRTQVAESQGDLTQATSLAELGVRLAPNLAPARANLARLAGRLGQPARAEENWRIALRLRPDFPPYLAALATQLAVHGAPDQRAEAARLAARAIELRPDFARDRALADLARSAAPGP